ncbi:MAG: hypothetical protein M1387_01235 [Thaumarchaeota archaeon]|nr:hypothetical protein [Nitrososphaerota archaeon]
MTGKSSTYLALLLIALSPTILLAPAHAQMICPTDNPLGSLPTCITHHYEMGDINNQGIYKSLQTKADNAVTLFQQGNNGAAINKLNALINELEAQKGHHITPTAADMLIMHAEMAITQISG